MWCGHIHLRPAGRPRDGYNMGSISAIVRGNATAAVVKKSPDEMIELHDGYTIILGERISSVKGDDTIVNIFVIGRLEMFDVCPTIW